MRVDAHNGWLERAHEPLLPKASLDTCLKRGILRTSKFPPTLFPFCSAASCSEWHFSDLARWPVLVRMVGQSATAKLLLVGCSARDVLLEARPYFATAPPRVVLVIRHCANSGLAFSSRAPARLSVECSGRAGPRTEPGRGVVGHGWEPRIRVSQSAKFSGAPTTGGP
jgi:hypothetical protein